MTTRLIPGLLGLLTGLILHWGTFSHSDGLRSAWGLKRSLTLRTCLTALGWGVILTALLMWLAVIDVDTVTILPLSPGVLLGGAVFGICAGLCGFTPTTAFAGLGSGNALEALCVLAGCFAGTLLLPPLDAAFLPLRAEPWLEATLFRVTLDEPWLLSGSFLGLGCLGAVLALWGMCIPSPRPVILSDEVIAARAAEVPTEPDATAGDTVIASLEGEEPLVIDTALDEPDAAETDPEEPDPPSD